MNIREKKHARVQKLTTLSILVALTIALQLICTVIKFGPFSITLALTPIIIGAALYGPVSGALLGFVFSAVVYITGLLGMDGGFILMMMDYNAIATTLLCLLKGTAAGFVAGLVYRALAKRSKNAACIVSSIAAPVVNTGLFALGIISLFFGFLSGFAAEGESAIGVLFLSWIGVNFIVEFVVNVALGTVLSRVIDYFNSKMRVS